MKSIRLKWLSLIVTLCVAFGAVFSAAAAFKTVKADDADVTVSVDDRYLSAGNEFSFEIYAYSETGFSSYQLKLVVPDFVKVKGITSRMGGGDAEFEYAQKGYEYNITFTSDNNEYGNKTLFEVNAVVDADAQGKSGACFISDAKFTDTNVSRLSVETIGAMFYVSGNFEVMKGDFDGNGRVTIEDVMLMQRTIAYELRASETQMQAGDIDNNGVIDIYDCQYVRSYIIGLIDSLDNIGGGGDNPHGGDDKIYGAYTHTFDEGYTVTLNLYDDHRFTEDFSNGSSSREGTFVNDGNSVYLVVGYTMERITLYPDEGIFDTFGDVNFDREPATVEGYAGTYRVNGSTEDIVAVAENGAFIRTCYEDGHQIQHNGMITLENGDEQVNGTAYVFGNYGSEYLMAMPFTMDTKNNVIYVKQNQHGGEPQEEYEFIFEIVDTGLGNSYQYRQTYRAGTSYSKVYNDFLNRYADELNKKFNGISFDNPVAESGKSVFDDNSIVEFSDKITFYFETKLDPTRLYYDVRTIIISLKDGREYEKDYYVQLYYGCSARDVANAINGKDAFVYHMYRDTDHSSSSVGNREPITLSASMLGDISKIDFNDYSLRYVEIPLNVTYNGNPVSATLNVMLVPDITDATLVKTCVAPSDPEGNSYKFLRIYDNGWVAACQYGTQDSENAYWGYTHYVAEEYIGKTVYIVNNGGPDEAWALSGERYNGYEVLSYLLPEGNEATTVYYLSMGGMNAKFYVFGQDYYLPGEAYAAMYVVQGEKEELNGTCKVLIENGQFHYNYMTFEIKEGNVLALEGAADKELVLIVDYQGFEIRLYDDGTGEGYLNDALIMPTVLWSQISETVINLDFSKIGGPSDETYYLWNIDGNYHRKLAEPDWNNGTSYRLMHVKDGATTVYTLYVLNGGAKYLFNNSTRTMREMDSYTDGILSYYSNPMTGEKTYYYYDAKKGILYDAVKYQLVGADGNSYGYVYVNDDNAILYGHWNFENGPYTSGLEATFAFNAENKTYVVSNDGTWLFTATPVMASSAREENKFIVSDYARKTNGNGGETHEEMYEVNVYNVLNGKIQGDATYLSVESFDEFAAFIDKALKDRPAEGAPVFNGYYYDINGKEPVNERNFRSGDVYLLFVQRSSDGSASGSAGE